MKITTQKELRAQFWTDNPNVSRKRIKSHDGIGRMYTADTRAAFCEYIDALHRSGVISKGYGK